MTHLPIKGEKHSMDDLFGEKNIETPPSAHDWIQSEFSLCKSEAPTHLQKNVHQTNYLYSVKNCQILPKNS